MTFFDIEYLRNDTR